MDELLSRAAAFGFAGQAVVAIGGEVVLDGAYGVADRATGRSMTADTMTGIASLSKQFTAAAVLALAEAGRLELEAPVGRYLPGLSPEKGAATLHQLLTHTAGLAGGDIGDDFAMESREELLRRIDEAPLAGPPGKRWRYSNAGYHLLAATVESVSGRPYEEYVEERIFRRAGLERTGFWSPPPAPRDVAHAYRGWMDQGSPASWPRNWRTFGAGDVLSTAGDLYRWEIALRTGSVLSAGSGALLRTPHAAVGDSGDAYGYGWFLHPVEGGTSVAEHGGDWLGGYNAFHYVDPARDLVLALTCNASDASGMWLRQAVQKALIDLASGEDVELPPAARTGLEVDRDLLGTYRLADGTGTLHLFHDGAHAWLAAEGQEAANLLLGVDGEEAEGLRRAARRSARLLAGLLAERPDAYAEALGAEGRPHLADYEGEWARLVGRFGPLDSYRVLGASPSRFAAGVGTRLSLGEAELSFSMLWADGGGGRLSGTLVRDRPGTPMPLPAAYPTAVAADGSLVAWDLFRDVGMRLAVTETSRGRRLELRSLGGGGSSAVAWGAESVVPTAAGWRPRGGGPGRVPSVGGRW